MLQYHGYGADVVCLFTSVAFAGMHFTYTLMGGQAELI